jgi:hypothetical protein
LIKYLTAAIAARQTNSSSVDVSLFNYYYLLLQGDSHISGSAHLGGTAVAAITWAKIQKRRF